jgi:putative zinc finger/helix-turn-helix YgiT family protein
MTSRTQCPACGKGRLQKKAADLEASRKGEAFIVTMEALVCPKCDFKTVPTKMATQFALRTANAYRQRHGLLTSMDIKDYRSTLKMNQEEFSDFLGAGEASVKRWELGEIQSHAMDQLMRLAFAAKMGTREQYRPWGGFEQLEDKMAVQVYQKPERRGLNGMPNAPPGHLRPHTTVS